MLRRSDILKCLLDRSIWTKLMTNLFKLSFQVSYLSGITNKEALLCSVLNHAANGKERKKCGVKHKT